MVAPVLVDSSLIDPGDKQVYKTIRLYGKWWMAENLLCLSRLFMGLYVRMTAHFLVFVVFCGQMQCLDKTLFQASEATKKHCHPELVSGSGGLTYSCQCKIISFYLKLTS
ncbi:MAG: hypothetical protein J7L96_05330 [Bacteroidales bacterium]|nr:hypothetical protein [Bacteroidales bacterium]